MDRLAIWKQYGQGQGDIIPVTIVESENSTCRLQIKANVGFEDYNSKVNLKYDEDTNYWYTEYPLEAYYKPKNKFICCYISPTYGMLYTDGYGLNFYTNEYGYYEYCNNYGGGGGNVGIFIGIMMGFIIILIFSIWLKRKCENKSSN